MIQSFANTATENIYEGKNTKAARRLCPTQLIKAARRKLDQLNYVDDLESLYKPPSNHFEALSGRRNGQYSIRINHQYRICFSWTDKGPVEVEIVDYH